MKRKFILSLVLVIVLSLSACAGNESPGTEETLKNHTVTPAEDFEFRADDQSDGWSLCGYKGKDEIVVIPEEVDGKKVVSITGTPFGEGSGVKVVKISDSVERISLGFRGNEELQYVIFGSGLKEIGEESFFGCHSLEKVELNDGVEKLVYNAFANMNSLTYLYVPDTVTEIIGPAIHIANEDFVLAGKTGSMAEDYAKLLHYDFEAVE